MLKTLRIRQGAYLKLSAVMVFAILLSACNLGAQVPAEPVEEQPAVAPEGEIIPQDVLPTETPIIAPPPTATVEAALLPEETLGPVSVEGTAWRTQEPVTVRVRRGKAVSNVTCSRTLQDTSETLPLGTPVTTQIDDITFEEVFTFTPEQAGTYVVNCTAIATTASGVRSVSAAGQPFAVEAKG